MSERQHFCLQVGAAAKDVPHPSEEHDQKSDRRLILAQSVTARNLCELGHYDIIGRDRCRVESPRTCGVRIWSASTPVQRVTHCGKYLIDSDVAVVV